jgi:hypothetical protein
VAALVALVRNSAEQPAPIAVSRCVSRWLADGRARVMR